MRLGTVFAVLLLATPALAEAPALSLRPPLKATEQQPEAPRAALANALHNAGIPGFSPEDAAKTMGFASASPLAVALSHLPELRPDSLVTRVMSQREGWRKGSVCGDPAIQGERVGFVPGRISGCGIKDAVRVSSVSGVALSQQAMLSCPTAKALKRWVDTAAKPALGSMGGGISGLHVAAHYACRSRNNVAGAKVSEHGKGRAIDIAGIRLKNGDDIVVLRDWHSGAKGRALQSMHQSACGIFGTTLGPGSDGYHEDHLHYDIARHGNGAYCR
ncbi:extensin family protein [Citreicella sp. C3M06]|uniref:extensin-like domain-containing protein n=1 Tax=Citreicella sp. C3M06 TaxID=2841564 RepID=UPI001C08D80D|nr:extensin family protein [Citreicella sp. C3M06]MBU2959715.1 extensin family protein [Citreicella sp. C3M06]